MKLVKVILVAATVSLGAQAAVAAEVRVGEDRLTQTVVYGDLDLRRDEGVTALYTRLNRASKAVCAPLRGRSAGEKAEHRACVNQALANAVSDVNQPLLTQYYRSRGEKSAAAVVAKR